MDEESRVSSAMRLMRRVGYQGDEMDEESRVSGDEMDEESRVSRR